MKIYDVKLLITKYGGETTLNEILKFVQGNKIYVCPVCGGKGYNTVEYNSYPSGLPDSGWVYEPAYKNVSYELCKGEGYTTEEYVPNMVQDGWKTK